MSLFAATFYTGLALLLLGFAFLWNGLPFRHAVQALPRSANAAFLLFGAASLWFLWHINNLSPADFGDYRLPLLALFGTVAIGAYFVARDFLAVRGLAILFLLIARPLLDAAFLQPPASRLFLVAFVYAVLIPVGLILGAMPYLLRDWINWLWQKPARPRLLGATLTLYGLLLAYIAYSYPA